MRAVTAASILALVLVAQGAHGKERAVKGSAAGGAVSRLDEGSQIAETQFEKEDAVERARQERMRRATRGICTGC
jgi:hypothetical protein